MKMQKTITIMLVSLFLMSSIGMLVSNARADTSYSISLPIGGSSDGDLTNYQMKLVVHSGLGVNTVGNVYLSNLCTNWPYDIHFTDGIGNLLSFWRQSYNSTEQVDWIKIPSIPTSGISYNIVYGNGDDDTSNGMNTFQFFDDFVGSTLNDSAWGYSGDTPTLSDGILTLYSSYHAGAVLSVSMFGNHTSFMTSVSLPSGTERGGVGYSDNVANYALIQSDYPTNLELNYRNGVLGVETNGILSSYTSSSYVNYQICRSGAQITYYVDDVLKGNYSVGTPEGVLPIQLSSNQGVYTYVDWIAVRSYIEHEPKWISPVSWSPTFVSSPSLVGVLGVNYIYVPYTNESAVVTLLYPSWAIWTGTSVIGAPWTNGGITGVPPVAGVYQFEIQATSTRGGLTSYQFWNVTVDQKWTPHFINEPVLKTTLLDTYTFSLLLNETGNITFHSLPSWMGIYGNNISGVPTVAGSYNISLSVIGVHSPDSLYLNWTVVVVVYSVPNVDYTSIVLIITLMIFMTLMNLYGLRRGYSGGHLIQIASFFVLLLGAFSDMTLWDSFATLPIAFLIMNVVILVVGF